MEPDPGCECQRQLGAIAYFNLFDSYGCAADQQRKEAEQLALPITDQLHSMVSKVEQMERNATQAQSTIERDANTLQQLQSRQSG